MNIPFYCHFNNVGSSVEIVGVKFPSPKNIDRTRLESITSEVRQKQKLLLEAILVSACCPYRYIPNARHFPTGVSFYYGLFMSGSVFESLFKRGQTVPQSPLLLFPLN